MSEHPFMSPREVLSAAFGNHDFLSGDLAVETSDVWFEGDVAFVDVDVTDNPIENAVSYRFRIEQDTEVS